MPPLLAVVDEVVRAGRTATDDIHRHSCPGPWRRDLPGQRRQPGRHEWQFGGQLKRDSFAVRQASPCRRCHAVRLTATLDSPAPRQFQPQSGTVHAVFVTSLAGENRTTRHFSMGRRGTARSAGPLFRRASGRPEARAALMPLANRHQGRSIVASALDRAPAHARRSFRTLPNLAVATCGLWLFLSVPAHAQLSGSHSLGDFGVQSGSQPAPGFYAALFLQRYDTDTITDADGQVVARLRVIRAASGLAR